MRDERSAARGWLKIVKVKLHDELMWTSWAEAVVKSNLDFDMT